MFLRGEEVLFKMFKNWYVDLLNNDYTAVPQRLSEGTIYYKEDLQNAKNLTRFARAFTFPGKENAFYYNEKSEKIYLIYKKES